MSVYVYTADTVIAEAERNGGRSCRSRTVAPCNFPNCPEDHGRRCSRPAGHMPDVHVCVQQDVVTAVWVVRR